jgi:hypothetical protein
MHSRLNRGDKASSNLQYGALVSSLLMAVPEIKKVYDALQVEIGPDVLPYPVFELVVEPLLKSALTANTDDDLSRRGFGFLEEMARAQDIEVVNLLAIAIFEPWVVDPGTLGRAWKYMGENTKRIASDTAHRLKRGDNLPRY